MSGGNGWPLVRALTLPERGYGLEVQAGATPAEIGTVVAGLPPASFVDHMPARQTGVVLLFRRFPDGVPDPAVPSGGSGGGQEAVTLPGGWVPDVAAVPDRGLTPYQVAAYELISAAADSAIGARVFDLVRREAPETVVALAGLLRDRTRGRCRCRADRHRP